MIEYLIIMLLAKYRDGFATLPRDKDSDWHLAPGAGIDFEAEDKRPHLRIVK